MSDTLHLDKDGFAATKGSSAGISISINTDVDTAVCVNAHISGDDGRHIILAGADLNITADSDSGKIVIVLHPGDLNAKCTDPRGDTKGPDGP